MAGEARGQVVGERNYCAAALGVAAVTIRITWELAVVPPTFFMPCSSFDP